MPDPDGIFADIYVIVFMESSTKQYGADAGPLAKAIDGYSSAANRLLVLVIRDVFEAKEAAATSEVEQLRTLVKTGMILSAKLSLEAVLQRIANMACKVVGARYGALGVLDGKGGLGQFITAGIDEKTKRAIGPLPVGKGILGVLVREAKPLRLTDLSDAGASICPYPVRRGRMSVSRVSP